MTEQQSVQPFQDKEPGRFRLILAALWRILRGNLGFKLLALVLAVALWAGLITQDPNLTRTKEMAGTPVTVSQTNESVLRSRGYVVTGGLQDVLENGVTIRAEVPQPQYNTVTGSSFSPTISYSNISGAGEHVVRILTSNSETNGTVLEVIPPTVTLTVERYVANEPKPVRIVAEGEAPDGWTITGARTDEHYLDISGPASVVSRIRYVEAVVPLASRPQEEGAQEMSVAFRLMDGATEVPTDNITVTYGYGSVRRSSVIVTVTVAAAETREAAGSEETPADAGAAAE